MHKCQASDAPPPIPPRRKRRSSSSSSSSNKNAKNVIFKLEPSKKISATSTIVQRPRRRLPPPPPRPPPPPPPCHVRRNKKRSILDNKNDSVNDNNNREPQDIVAVSTTTSLTCLSPRNVIQKDEDEDNRNVFTQTEDEDRSLSENWSQSPKPPRRSQYHHNQYHIDKTFNNGGNNEIQSSLFFSSGYEKYYRREERNRYPSLFFTLDDLQNVILNDFPKDEETSNSADGYQTDSNTVSQIEVEISPSAKSFCEESASLHEEKQEEEEEQQQQQRRKEGNEKENPQDFIKVSSYSRKSSDPEVDDDDAETDLPLETSIRIQFKQYKQQSKPESFEVTDRKKEENDNNSTFMDECNLEGEDDVCFRVTPTNFPFEKCLDRWKSSMEDFGTETEPNNFIFEDYMDRSNALNVRRPRPTNMCYDVDDEIIVPRSTSKVRFIIESPSSSTPDDEIEEKNEMTKSTMSSLSPKSAKYINYQRNDDGLETGSTIEIDNADEKEYSNDEGKVQVNSKEREEEEKEEKEEEEEKEKEGEKEEQEQEEEVEEEEEEEDDDGDEQAVSLNVKFQFDKITLDGLSDVDNHFVITNETLETCNSGSSKVQEEDDIENYSSNSEGSCSETELNAPPFSVFAFVTCLDREETVVSGMTDYWLDRNRVWSLSSPTQFPDLSLGFVDENSDSWSSGRVFASPFVGNRKEGLTIEEIFDTDDDKETRNEVIKKEKEEIGKVEEKQEEFQNLLNQLEVPEESKDITCTDETSKLTVESLEKEAKDAQLRDKVASNFKETSNTVERRKMFVAESFRTYKKNSSEDSPLSLLSDRINDGDRSTTMGQKKHNEESLVVQVENENAKECKCKTAAAEVMKQSKTQNKKEEEQQQKQQYVESVRRNDDRQSNVVEKEIGVTPFIKDINIPANLRRNSFLETMLSSDEQLNDAFWTPSSCEIIATHPKPASILASVEEEVPKLPKESNDVCIRKGNDKYSLKEVTENSVDKLHLEKSNLKLKLSRGSSATNERKRNAVDAKSDVLNELLANFATIKLKSANNSPRKNADYGDNDEAVNLKSKETSNVVKTSNKSCSGGSTDDIDDPPGIVSRSTTNKEEKEEEEELKKMKTQDADIISNEMAVTRIQAEIRERQKSEARYYVKCSEDSFMNKTKTTEREEEENVDSSKSKIRSNGITQENSYRGHCDRPSIFKIDESNERDEKEENAGQTDEYDEIRRNNKNCVNDEKEEREKDGKRGKTKLLRNDVTGSASKCAIDTENSLFNDNNIDININNNNNPCNNNDNNRDAEPVAVSKDQSRDDVTIIPGRVRNFVKYYEIRGETSSTVTATTERCSKMIDNNRRKKSTVNCNTKEIHCSSVSNRVRSFESKEELQKIAKVKPIEKGKIEVADKKDFVVNDDIEMTIDDSRKFDVSNEIDYTMIAKKTDENKGCQQESKVSEYKNSCKESNSSSRYKKSVQFNSDTQLLVRSYEFDDRKYDKNVITVEEEVEREERGEVARIRNNGDEESSDSYSKKESFLKRTPSMDRERKSGISSRFLLPPQMENSKLVFYCTV